MIVFEKNAMLRFRGFFPMLQILAYSLCIPIYRWWCHFDDDNYVHVLRLSQLLHSYSADSPVYLGKPSTARPIEISDRSAPQVVVIIMLLDK